MNVTELVEQLRREWSTPRHAVQQGEMTSFKLCCTFSPTTAKNELTRIEQSVPGELVEFWNHTSSARLFEDVSYGQWGLMIHSPDEAQQATQQYRMTRPHDITLNDLIIGQFIGDSDLLLLTCDPRSTEFGRIIIATPLDPRSDWCVAANSFAEFLIRYVSTEGAKYWERR